MTITTCYSREPLLRGAKASVGYHSVSVARRDGRSGSPGSHEAHTLSDRRPSIDLSRAYRRDNPIYQGTIRRGGQFVVGGGFQLVLSPAELELAEQLAEDALRREANPRLALSPMQAWCNRVERDWREWWGTNSKRRRRSKIGKRRMKPDVRQVLSGPRLEMLAACEALTCGDTGLVLLGEGGEERVQAVEAEQITGSNSQYDDGIEKDRYGTPTGFHVCPYNRGQIDVTKKNTYKPEEFLFITADPERASGVRVMPPLQASFSTLDRLNDICDAEAVAWQIQSRMALILEREDGPPIASTISREDPASNDPTGHASGDRITDFDLGIIFHAAKGETARGMERTAPSKSFRESFRELLRTAGLPINMALEFMLLDFSEDNYSQTRALIALFVDWILATQMALSDQLHDPLFDWWLAKRLKAQDKDVRIPEPPEDFEASWIYPAFPGVDLNKETEAWKNQIQLGIRSWSAAVKGQNQDPDMVRRQKVRDRVDAIRAAGQVERETGVKTDWQGFCGEPLPGAIGNKGPEPMKAQGPAPDDQDDDEVDEDEQDDEDGTE